MLADGRRARLVCVLSTPHRAWYRIISLEIICARPWILWCEGVRGVCVFLHMGEWEVGCHTPGWMTAGALGSRVCSRRRAKQGLESSHGSPRVCAILGPVIRRRARCARVPSLGYSPHASIDASPLALSHSRRPHPRIAPNPPSKRTAPKPKVGRLTPGVPSSELRSVGGGGGGDGGGGDDGGDGGGGGGGD